MSRSLILAWLVHLYTALGAIVGFFSILAIEQGSFREAFFLMALTVVIDATDGTLARAARVKEVIPWFKSTYMLKMDDKKQTQVPVSRSQTKRLRELFKI